MIDTIVLNLANNQYSLDDYDRFTPSAKGLFESPFYPLKSGYCKCIQNPEKSYIRAGYYLPRLELIKRKNRLSGNYEVSLRIELSLPKLMYGNNFQELSDCDLGSVAYKLQSALKMMGIEATYKNIVQAKVSAIHYGKNLILERGTTCSMILNELSKINLSSRLDAGKTDFRNSGEIIRYHANSYEVVFYDKVKDLEKGKKSERRAEEKDNYIQTNLLDQLKTQVLRVEIRLNKSAKIKEMLGKAGIQKELTLKELFSEDIARRITCHYWGIIDAESKTLQIETKGACELFENLLKNNSNINPLKLLQIFSVVVLRKEGGEKRLRNMLGYTGKGSRKWYALQKSLKGIKYCKQGSYQAINEINSSLKKFKRIENLIDFDP